MVEVTVRLPEGIYATLRRSPRELEQEIRLAAAIDWYRRGMVSQGRASEIAGLTRSDFIDALAARQVEVVEVDLDALKAEVERG